MIVEIKEGRKKRMKPFPMVDIAREWQLNWKKVSEKKDKGGRMKRKIEEKEKKARKRRGRGVYSRWQPAKEQGNNQQVVATRGQRGKSLDINSINNNQKET